MVTRMLCKGGTRISKERVDENRVPDGGAQCPIIQGRPEWW